MIQIVNRLDLSEHMRERDEYFAWRKMADLPSESREGSLEDSASETKLDDDDNMDEEGNGNGDQLIELERAEVAGQGEGLESQPSDEYELGTSSTHTCPKRPFRSQVTIAQVAREHGVPDLSQQLQLYYLRRSGGAAANRRVVGYELDPLLFGCVDLYKQFQGQLPALPYQPKSAMQLTVKADPKVGKKVRQRPEPYYSVVLIDEKGEGQTEKGLKGQKEMWCNRPSQSLLFVGPCQVSAAALCTQLWKFLLRGPRETKKKSLHMLTGSYDS